MLVQFQQMVAAAAWQGRVTHRCIKQAGEGLMTGIIQMPPIAKEDHLVLQQRRAIEEKRNGRLDLAKALVQLGRPFNYHDFTQYDLDAPFPGVGNLSLNSYKGGAERRKAG